MKILVINSGSSSLKYQLMDMSSESILAKGNCEKIGSFDSFIVHKAVNDLKKKFKLSMENHTEAFTQVKDILLDPQYGVIKDLNEVTAVGHRVTQGGSIFHESVLVTEEVIQGIESLIPIAPLHNKAQAQGIKACINVFGKDIPQVVVFDTAFHSTLPPKAFLFPVPYEYYEKYKIRRYGFHGTSHRFVSHKCAELMGKNIANLKIITCHLGNGSSIAAIENGKVIDTSMGFTPLDGFIMGTRSGTLDPSVVTFIAEKERFSPSEMNTLLNKKSGLLGISGISNDDRDIKIAAKNGNERAKLAQTILRYQIAKFIGGYITALNGCDAIVFTAGIGENDPDHRSEICKYFKYLGVELSNEKNLSTIRGKQGKISTENSKIDVFVIPTNEELIIALDTQKIVSAKSNRKA